MKAMTSVLFSSLLFLFNCEEEATSVELPEDIDVGIRFKLADLSQNHALCKKKYEVEFWVDNCAGGRSSTMSYTYLGCVELNGICFVQKQTKESWNIAIDKWGDQFHWQLKHNDGSLGMHGAIYGMDMYNSTNEGADDFVIALELQ